MPFVPRNNLFPDSSQVDYIPSVILDWSSNPQNVQEALDELAARTHNASDIDYIPSESAITCWYGSADPGDVGSALDQLILRLCDIESNPILFYIFDTHSSHPSNPSTGQFYYNSVTHLAYFYNGTSWISMSGGGSGSSAFNDITSGTNTSATMVVDTGSSLSYSGSGSINSNLFKGSSTIAISSGGTGQTTANAAFNALSPMTALGDIIYGAASGVGSRLAGNTTSTKKFLTQTGDGVNSSAPGWNSIVSGDLPSIAHSSLTGLTSGDDHTQYITLSPTTGTRNVITAAAESTGLKIIAGATIDSSAETFRITNSDGSTDIFKVGIDLFGVGFTYSKAIFLVHKDSTIRFVADPTFLVAGEGSITMGYNSGRTTGTINTSSSSAANGGLINTSGGAAGAGGAINTSGGASAAGGSITTSNGGGSIDTTGNGSIQFGVSASRTTLNGSGSAVTVTLPATTTTLMGLAGNQTVTGVKTYNVSTLLINNSANTFASTFATNATAARTITFPDLTSTVCMASTSTTSTQALFATSTAGAPAYRAIANGDLGGITSISTLVHNTLSGLTSGDDHTQYIYNAPAALTRNTIQPTGDYNGLILKGFSSQVVDLFKIITSASVSMFLVSASGDITNSPIARTTGSPNLFTVTGPSHTTLTASTEAIDVIINLARTVQFSTGAITNQRAIRVQSPTYSFVGSSTITHASTLSISGAPVKGTNASLTTTSALRIEAGAVSTASSSFGIYCQAQTGATNNYAAGFTGGFVGIGTVEPTGTLDVVSSTNSSNAQFLVENHAANNTPAAISYAKSRGSKSSTTSVNTLDYLGIFLFRAADAVNTLRQVGTFGVRANGTIASNSVPSEMFFGVSPGYNSTDPFADATIQLLLSADTTVAINSTTKGTGQFNVFNGSASRVATIIRGTTSQSADLLQLQTVTPTTVFSVSANGDTTIAPIVRTTGSPNLVVVTGPAHTTLTASTEATDINFNLARTVQFAAGTLSTQRAMRIQAPTYGFVGASTLSHASTVSITGAPVKGTNTTLTNTSALRIEAGGVSTATNAYSLYVAKPSGATASYTAYFEETVGIGVISPSAYLNIKGGTTAASTAPLKIENGSLTSSPESGAIERTNKILYFTPNAKRGVLQTSSQENITMAADVNNYAIDDATSYLAVDSDGSSLFTGIAGTQYGGRVVYIVCLLSCGQKLTISHQHASSSAANRFDCVGGVDLTVTFGGMAICVYDSTENNWKVYTV